MVLSNLNLVSIMFCTWHSTRLSLVVINVGSSTEAQCRTHGLKLCGVCGLDLGIQGLGLLVQVSDLLKLISTIV